MAMRAFMRDSRGSAVEWFAMVAVVLSVASMAGTRMLAWLSQPGRIVVSAYHAPDASQPRRAAAASSDIDLTPVGSISFKPSIPSKTLVIRLR